MYCIQILQEKFLSLYEIEKFVKDIKNVIKIKDLFQTIENSIVFLKEDWPEDSSIKNELEDMEKQLKLFVKGKENEYYIGRWQEIAIRLEELVIVKKYLLTLHKYLLVLDKFIISLKEYNKLESSNNYSFLAILLQSEDHLISIKSNKKQEKNNKKINNLSNISQNNHINSTNMKSLEKQRSYKNNKKTIKNRLLYALQEKKSMSEFYFNHLQRVIKIMKALTNGKNGIKDNLITRIKQRISNFSKKEYNTGNYTETYLILFEVLNHLKKI